ncbi:MAG: 2-C-methyl-D-erythritol 4-phosphate cytidylyltransferase [Spirochaetales bacterium]|nr:2-C-methyl-D-erythritol 4-phosphate cytidylyltransferase [Spirochaetales bacterium]
MESSGTFAALITAAGRSTRMGDGIKKEYRRVNGLPLLSRIYQQFTASGLFTFFVITCPPGDEDAVGTLLNLSANQEDTRIIAGGDTRQDSVLAGLAAMAMVDPDYVLIHDGSRPWVSPELVTRVCEGTRAWGACIPVVPAVDTLAALDENGSVAGWPDRQGVYLVQTPQGFRFTELYEAHRKASSDGLTYHDDSEIYGRYVGGVKTVPGDPANRKITYPGDLPESAIL